MKVAAVLRRSLTYDVDYVYRLYQGVRQYLPEVEFVCLSDVVVSCPRIPLLYDWPGWWSKMELFRPDIEDDLLYFDLDTVIKGDLRDISLVRELTMLRDFYVPSRLASGMMFLPADARRKVWDIWIAAPDKIMDRYQIAGDQGFLAEVYGGSVSYWQDLLPGQIISYKVNIVRRRVPRYNENHAGNVMTPAGARVVCFHGRPRPRDIKWEV